MEESELKKFESVKDTNLENTVGGHRHSRAYRDGWTAGRVTNMIGTAASIGLGILGLCCVAKNNKN